MIGISEAEAGAMVGADLEAMESRKHLANDDAKCSALEWVSTSLVVNSYGAWGKRLQLLLFLQGSFLGW